MDEQPLEEKLDPVKNTDIGDDSIESTTSSLEVVCSFEYFHLSFWKNLSA